MTPTAWLALLFVTAWTVAAAAFVRRWAMRHGAWGRRLFRRRDTTFAVGVLLFFVSLAALASYVAPYRPSAQLDIVALQNQPPSLTHPLGTDLYSRDVWSRLIWGGRISLAVGTVAMVLALTVGTIVGATAGYYRRWIDTVLMRIVDVGLSVPRIFYLLVVVALWDHLELAPLVLLLGLTGWFATSRLVRAEVLSLRERNYVEGARALGARTARVIFRHVLPNAAAPILISAALGIGNVLLLEAGLSFLGVGVQPPAPSWGNMIADARDQLATAPWASLFPGLAITCVVMALHTLADALRDALDPRANHP